MFSLRAHRVLGTPAPSDLGSWSRVGPQTYLGMPRENQSTVTIHSGKPPEDNQHFSNGKLNDGGFFDCWNKPIRAGEGYCCANYQLLLLTADRRGEPGLPKRVRMAVVGVKEQGGKKAATQDILMMSIWILLHLTFSPF